jgi:hypothetical protein
VTEDGKAAENNYDWARHYEEQAKREEKYRDAADANSRVSSCLLDAKIAHGTDYGALVLKNARQHAERLLGVIRELGG